MDTDKFDNMKCCKVLWGSEYSHTILVEVPMYMATLEDILTDIIKTENAQTFYHQAIQCLHIHHRETHSKAHNDIHCFLLY